MRALEQVWAPISKLDERYSAAGAPALPQNLRSYRGPRVQSAELNPIDVSARGRVQQGGQGLCHGLTALTGAGREDGSPLGGGTGLRRLLE